MAQGVYHGLREKHLQSYLDEFTFLSLLGIAVAKKPSTYNILIKPEETE